jgi:hypothetical protein
VILLAQGQNAPRRIAVDASWVYWINRWTDQNNFTDGEVVAVAK